MLVPLRPHTSRLSLSLSLTHTHSLTLSLTLFLFLALSLRTWRRTMPIMRLVPFRISDRAWLTHYV